MGATSLRRYTNLAAAIHLLRKRCLTLVDSVSWEDKNDAYFLAQYNKRVSARSVLALCFAEAPETFHHWWVFSSRTNGICIEFDKARLLKAIGKDSSVMARSVVYKEVKNVKLAPIGVEELPFVKRFPYKDEREFRLLHVNHNSETDFHHIDIPLNSISRITLSPWMHVNLANETKHVLKDIEGCEKIKIYRSTLVNNEYWIKAAN
jgi:hypothetical protein